MGEIGPIAVVGFGIWAYIQLKNIAAIVGTTLAGAAFLAIFVGAIAVILWRKFTSWELNQILALGIATTWGCWAIIANNLAHTDAEIGMGLDDPWYFNRPALAVGLLLAAAFVYWLLKDS